MALASREAVPGAPKLPAVVMRLSCASLSHTSDTGVFVFVPREKNGLTGGGGGGGLRVAFDDRMALRPSAAAAISLVPALEVIPWRTTVCDDDGDMADEVMFVMAFVALMVSSCRRSSSS